MPLVSVCVPNLNTRPFLPERFRTISEQSFQDWELLVYDSYSTDGAWEYIKELASREPRMRIWQGPREGTPGSWNPCVREARGEYVYIATSDDTMAPDCLEKLVASLERRPDCDIAHCPLRSIDGNGTQIQKYADWWSQSSSFATSSREWSHHHHIRRAPFDGLLHLLGAPVYVSVTQLLIRRALFDRIGLFESTWGSVGDFHWCMRAGLVANTVHVPETWGGWRVHAGQATANAGVGSPDHTSKIEAMIEHAIDSCSMHLTPSVREPLLARWRREAKQVRVFMRESARRSALARKRFIVTQALAGSAPAWHHLTKVYLKNGSWADWVRERLEQTGIGPLLVADDFSALDRDSIVNRGDLDPMSRSGAVVRHFP